MKIFIVGFMGSGKSTFGKKLAKALGYEFYDLDMLIEDKAQCSITDIFKYLGEDAFRKMESDILHSFSEKENFVLATGGGAPCYFDNMDFILQQGTSIYLDLDTKSIFDRLKNAKKIRPTIANMNEDELMSFIDQTLQKREPVYSKANYTFSGISINVDKVLAVIAN